MILYFLRHGMAEDRDTWGSGDDLRPLTSIGKKTTLLCAKSMLDRGVTLDLILTSPLVRARQTAEITAEVFDLVVEQEERLSPGFDLSELKEILSKKADLSQLMLVGHEPDFSLTVSALIGGGDIVFKKGALARVDIINPLELRGELVWLVPTKFLK